MTGVNQRTVLALMAIASIVVGQDLTCAAESQLTTEEQTAFVDIATDLATCNLANVGDVDGIQTCLDTFNAACVDNGGQSCTFQLTINEESVSIENVCSISDCLDESLEQLEELGSSISYQCETADGLITSSSHTLTVSATLLVTLMALYSL